MKIILGNGELKEIEKGTKESLDVLNHSTSHLLAEAIQELYPDALFGFGPAIDEGFYYDIDFKNPITDEDLIKIESKMHEFSSKKERIERREVSKEEALEIFKNNPYKIELINGIEGRITIFSQGNFTDLCAGPHVLNTDVIKHFKLLSIAGAYWRGDSKNKQLCRIYGTSFYTEEDLQNHLQVLEERKKRDHRILGKQLGLFLLSEYGPGFPFWLPNGYTLRRTLEDYWLNLHKKNGYVVVDTPIMLNRKLWETSGHWDHYHEDMYVVETKEETFAIKPMNCPGAIIVYNSSLHSYRDLPLRVAELGHVHRNEASGALNGLFRVRTFTQDDAHTFLRESQIESEISNILRIYDEVYSLFGLDYSIELSTRPEENFIGDIEVWNKAEEELAKACKATGHSFKINPGDGAFYGPKLDFKLRDSMNRIWQCGTVQLDFQLPGRFNCTYIDEKGNKQTPVMIHRACFGSIERFIGIITENYAGAFPLWLAPIQIAILPVNNEAHLEKCDELNKKLSDLGFRCEIMASEDKLGYRLRNAQINKIPLTLVVGDKEKNEGVITYRFFGTKNQITISYEEFVKMILDKCLNKE